MNDRQLVLDTVEEICADTNDIDEVCMALEHSTIFATEMIQNLVEVIDKYKSTIDKIKEYVKENTRYYDKELGLVEMMGAGETRTPVVYLYGLLELLEEVE